MRCRGEKFFSSTCPASTAVSSSSSSANSGTCFNTSGLQDIGHLSAEWDCFSVFQAFDASATRDSFASSKPDDWQGFKKHSAMVGQVGKGGKLGKMLRTKTPWVKTRRLKLFPYSTTRISTSCAAAYSFSRSDILCPQRPSPSGPLKEMMTASTCFVAAVTIVLSESLVALPCGPTVSANNGNPSRFKWYLPMPLYVSPSRPARKIMSPTTCPRSYSPTGRRLSTDTRLITSTMALISGKPFPATTRRNSASAEFRYRAGSFPKALYALRVVSTCVDSSTPRGKGNF